MEWPHHSCERVTLKELLRLYSVEFIMGGGGPRNVVRRLIRKIPVGKHNVDVFYDEGGGIWL